MFCRKCGYELAPEDKFCMMCGEKVIHKNEMPETYVVECEEDLFASVQKLKNGEMSEFEKIYNKTYKYVYARAKYMMGNEEDALDLMQEVYIILFRGVKNIEVNESLYSWLKAVVFRQGIKMIDKRNKNILLSEEEEAMFISLPDEMAKTEDDYVDKQDAQTIRTCIERLSEEQRLVILAYYYDGMSVSEIAKVLDISEGTVKSRLHLARKRLRLFLTEQEKKQGYKFRAIGVPTLLWAIGTILDEDVSVSAKECTGMYERICTGLSGEVVQRGIESVIVESSQDAISNVSKVKGTSSIGTTLAKTVSKAAVKKIILSIAGVATVGTVAGTALIGRNKDGKNPVNDIPMQNEIMQDDVQNDDMQNDDMQNDDAQNDNVQNDDSQNANSEDEYIFPNSNKEYLTDEELKSLSPEILALGRNEIFARYGRKFANETYKKHFESTSWYNGTIEGKAFDETYEDLLNEFEKYNISLIKSYEEKHKTAEKGKELYAWVLSYYKKFIEEGSIVPVEYINDIHCWNQPNIEDLYYAFVDLAGDGEAELFIANGKTIVDMYSYLLPENDEYNMYAETDHVVWEFFPSLGEKSRLTICSNNCLKVEKSEDSQSAIISCFIVEADTTNRLCVEAIQHVYNEGKYYWGTSDQYLDIFRIESSATEEDFENMKTKYSQNTSITWYSLADWEE